MAVSFSGRRRSDNARIVLGSLLIDPVFAIRAAAMPGGLHFPGEAFQAVASLALAHYAEHGSPPGRSIVALVAEVAEQRGDDSATPLMVVVEDIADRTNDFTQPEESCSERALKLAADVTSAVQVKALHETLGLSIETGRYKEATDAIAAFTPSRLEPSSHVSPFRDEAAVRAAFLSAEEPDLIEFPGDMGEFLAGDFRRDCFVTFLAGEKVGKSWHLLNVAIQALRQRRRVAFFECGDLSRVQWLRRFGVRVSRRPERLASREWPFVVKHPTALRVIRTDGVPSPDLEFDSRTYDDPLDDVTAAEGVARFARTHLRTSREMFRLSCHSNSTLSVKDIAATLRNWSREDFVPDVVVIDYADILAPMPGFRMEVRDQINASWKAMRTLSQEYSCLVVTATQANAKSYERDTLNRTHFSEDKRKLSHPTGMIGISATADEKVMGVQRLNWIARRAKHYDPRQCLYLAGCLAIGNPAVISRLP